LTLRNEPHGGNPFTKTSLHNLLTNVVYIGKVFYKGEVHSGQHVPIVKPEVWQRVQKLLKRNNRTGGTMGRNKHGALLKGLLRCLNCNAAMTPSFSSKGNKRYRYYVCTSAQARGWDSCPSKSIPAGEIERFVVEEIRSVGKNPELVAATIAEATRQVESRLADLDAERRGLERDLRHWHQELGEVVALAHDGRYTGRLADLEDRVGATERRLSEIASEIALATKAKIDPEEAAEALAAFDPVWETLSPREQARIVRVRSVNRVFNFSTQLPC
jgi:site-specific DNA recombinase